ncbi:hypothetical protein WMW72_12380 [Paenibacillus filicis]|uniref:Uncharacterized protein n=1 Tax=Paenibacillus filicis TaxID=669464 RepID=A0ABU9DIL6_9BACL
MNQELQASSKKPVVISTIQILLYIAAAIHVFNGIVSLGAEGMEKKIISLAMILFGIASVWVAARLSTPHPARRQSVIVLAVLLIVLRVVEFTVWHSYGFLLGILLPILVIWRLNSQEAKAWFGLR